MNQEMTGIELRDCFANNLSQNLSSPQLVAIYAISLNGDKLNELDRFLV